MIVPKSGEPSPVPDTRREETQYLAERIHVIEPREALKVLVGGGANRGAASASFEQSVEYRKGAIPGSMNS